MSDADDTHYLLDAEWTDDCQGKRDYDGSILEISTRYWPRGGGFTVIETDDAGGVTVEENGSRPEILPSAHSSLIIRHKKFESLVLAEREFEAESFEQIEHQVIAWAQAQMDRAVAAIRAEFLR